MEWSENLFNVPTFKLTMSKKSVVLRIVTRVKQQVRQEQVTTLSSISFAK